MHVLGIDVGGTKTVCLLANDDGAILAEAREAGANLQGVGELALEKVLHSVMESALTGQHATPSAICLGIAGVDRAQDQDVVRGIMDRIGYKATILIVNDALIALQAAIGDAPGIVIVSEPAPQNTFLSLNVRRPPLDDVRVRRAIAMTVDRSFFVRAFQFGAGSVDDGDEPPFYWAYDPRAHMPSYDPQAAGQLLDAAGWRRDPASGYRSKAGKPLHLIFAYITNRDPDTRYAPVFQNAMKQIGIAVDLRNYPYNIFYAPASEGGVLNGGGYDVAMSGWVLGSDPDEATLWMCDQYPPLGYNWSFFCDPRLDALEATALSSYDRDVRRRAYWQIQELLARDVPAVFVSWVNIIYATRDTVRDFHPGESWVASWDWRKE